MERRVPACASCQATMRILCACNCGRYRRKYGAHGQICLYVSGYNDNWRMKRRPLVDCAICSQKFKAPSTRSKICSIACRTQWLTINPPNERKRIPVECAACGKIVYRAPYQLKVKGATPACSKQCRYHIVSNKLSGRWSKPKRLALRRDDAQCRLCGFAIVVHIHHIIHKRHGGKDLIENLITLCPNHHAMVHREMIGQGVLYAKIKGADAVEAVA